MYGIYSPIFAPEIPDEGFKVKSRIWIHQNGRSAQPNTVFVVLQKHRKEFSVMAVESGNIFSVPNNLYRDTFFKAQS